MKYRVKAAFTDVVKGVVREAGDSITIDDPERAARLIDAGVLEDEGATTEPTYDELKDRATELEIEFKGNIGRVKLTDLIAAREAELAAAHVYGATATVEGVALVFDETDEVWVTVEDHEPFDGTVTDDDVDDQDED